MDPDQVHDLLKQFPARPKPKPPLRTEKGFGIPSVFKDMLDRSVTI